MAEMEIQVMDPAVLTLPLHVEEIVYLNRSIHPEILYTDTSQWTPEELNILDTIVRNWIFGGVREAMHFSPLFDLEGIKIIGARRKDTIGLQDPMTKFRMKLLGQSYPADAAISLEHYNIKDSVGINRREDGMFEAYMSFYSISAWRFYDLVSDTVLDSHVLREFSEWITEGETMQSALDKLPPAVDAIRETAFNAGMRYGERISPTWKATRRFYYTGGGKEMREAARFVAAGEWKRAAFLWDQLSEDEHEHERTAARASYNLSVHYEMEDDLVMALDWAVKSFSIRQDDLTLEYIDLLRKRYNDRKKLAKQLPVI